MKFKRLIPALAMLLVSAILLGTSTFAWFSMNTTVSATGLQIQAKSNAIFLLIGEETLTTADQIQAQTGDDLTAEAVTLSAGEDQVYPSKAFGVANASKDPASGLSCTAVTTKALAAAPGNWYTANSNDPTVWGSTDGKTINATELSAFSNYVIKRTFKLTLADGSEDANNLTVTPTITMKDTYSKTSDIALDGTKTYYTVDTSGSTPVYTAVASGDLDVANIGDYYEKGADISAVKVLVVSDNNVVAVFGASQTTAVNLFDASNNGTLSDTTVHTVDVYVYYDGTESAVYTNNAANLAGATINLVFGVSVAA